MLTLLHISDLHFGPHFRTEAGEALLRFAAETQPDIVVASGDFTQRAKRRQFAEAREFLSRLPPTPRVLLPGNHDVPLYRVHERLFTPYALYREYLESETDHSLTHPQAVIAAINTTSPLLRLTNGRLRTESLAYCRRVFTSAPAESVRIVAAHHPFAPPQDDLGGEMMRGRPQALEVFADLGVELVLGGHLHRSYIGSSLDVCPEPQHEHGILLVQAGTATSARGRATEQGKNSANVIQIDDTSIQVTTYIRGEDGRFSPVASSLHPPGEPASGFAAPLMATQQREQASPSHHDECSA